MRLNLENRGRNRRLKIRLNRLKGRRNLMMRAMLTCQVTCHVFFCGISGIRGYHPYPLPKMKTVLADRCDDERKVKRPCLRGPKMSIAELVERNRKIRDKARAEVREAVMIDLRSPEPLFTQEEWQQMLWGGEPQDWPYDSMIPNQYGSLLMETPVVECKTSVDVSAVASLQLAEKRRRCLTDPHGNDWWEIFKVCTSKAWAITGEIRHKATWCWLDPFYAGSTYLRKLRTGMGKPIFCDCPLKILPWRLDEKLAWLENNRPGDKHILEWFWEPEIYICRSSWDCYYLRLVKPPFSMYSLRYI